MEYSDVKKVHDGVRKKLRSIGFINVRTNYNRDYGYPTSTIGEHPSGVFRLYFRGKHHSVYVEERTRFFKWVTFLAPSGSGYVTRRVDLDTVTSEQLAALEQEVRGVAAARERQRAEERARREFEARLRANAGKMKSCLDKIRRTPEVWEFLSRTHPELATDILDVLVEIRRD